MKVGKFLAFLVILFLSTFNIFIVYADTVAHTFTSQIASALGSNNSKISVNSYLQYINLGDNTSVIGNYLSGYYLDSVLGPFQTNYLASNSEKVHIVSSTNKCNSGYGYKLGGYSYSKEVGYIDFDYDTNTFVYYCDSDQMLHGYAYNKKTGFQNFEGISFPIEVSPISTAVPPTQTGAFTNDSVEILNENSNNPNIIPSDTIQGNTFQFNIEKESLFYIIK